MTMYNKENNPYRHIDLMLKAAFVKSFSWVQRTYTTVCIRGRPIAKVMLAHAYSIGKGYNALINNNTQAYRDHVKNKDSLRKDKSNR